VSFLFTRPLDPFTGPLSFGPRRWRLFPATLSESQLLLFLLLLLSQTMIPPIRLVRTIVFFLFGLSARFFSENLPGKYSPLLCRSPPAVPPLPDPLVLNSLPWWERGLTSVQSNRSNPLPSSLNSPRTSSDHCSLRRLSYSSYQNRFDRTGAIVKEELGHLRCSARLMAFVISLGCFLFSSPLPPPGFYDSKNNILPRYLVFSVNVPLLTFPGPDTPPEYDSEGSFFLPFFHFFFSLTFTLSTGAVQNLSLKVNHCFFLQNFRSGISLKHFCLLPESFCVPFNLSLQKHSIFVL